MFVSPFLQTCFPLFIAEQVVTSMTIMMASHYLIFKKLLPVQTEMSVVGIQYATTFIDRLHAKIFTYFVDPKCKTKLLLFPTFIRILHLKMAIKIRNKVTTKALRLALIRVAR